MKMSLTFIRACFACLSMLVLTTYMLMTDLGGTMFANIAIGLASGLILSIALIAADSFVFRKCNLRTFNITLIGLVVGFFMGEALLFLLNAGVEISQISISPALLNPLKTVLFLITLYLGLALTARSADELHLSIPFVRLKAAQTKKKDILVDWTILMDSRILDLANSGLLDDHLIMPRFMLKEIYLMLENSDENTKSRARRCLEVFKKLETTPGLDLRYSEVDFADLRDPALKLTQLARLLDANIITADVTRFQPFAIEGTRIINIHMLSNALKPMTGEQISIKIQRYGKEPRQGVGYLEDGTMVVVNGGAEYIGETIKAHVLSVKHTSSGRMIFCNAAEEGMLMEGISVGLAHIATDLNNGSNKNYYTL